MQLVRGGAEVDLGALLISKLAQPRPRWPSSVYPCLLLIYLPWLARPPALKSILWWQTVVRHQLSDCYSSVYLSGAIIEVQTSGDCTVV